MRNADPRDFDPSSFSCFRFTHRSIDADGRIRLGYALDEELTFVEHFEVPVSDAGAIEGERVAGLLSLLHWVAGVSYFKTSLPPTIEFEGERPRPAAARLLEALYSEGLAELALRNELPGVSRPAFAAREMPRPSRSQARVRRALVPIGGGKDSIVALEIVRRSGLELSLFSVGNAPPLEGTESVSGLPRLECRRRIDPLLLELNRLGALNGHVPITSIIAAAALLTAELNGFDAVAFANERSASAANLTWRGVPVNHQFSKSAKAEALLRDAVREMAGPRIFSVLRPASDLAIARAFARMPEYHAAFVSCNRIFRLDPARRRSGWCCECDKCRFVFLALAPFLGPAELEGIFGAPLLDDPDQYDGFALLTGTGGHKPFECVGEVEESVAAIRLLAADPRWRAQRVVRRLSEEVLPRFSAGGDKNLARVLSLRADEPMPAAVMESVQAVLGA